MAVQNFTMVAGDSKTLIVTVRDNENIAVDISSSTIRWQAAKSFGKASVLSKTVGSGITLTDAANGIFSITLDPDDTENLKGQYHHEAEVTLPDGTISTVLFGTMKINQSLNEATAT